MELNDLIPERFRNNLDSRWLVKGKFLMYNHLENMPIATINDGVVYVSLDLRISKAVIQLVKHLVKVGTNFFFTSPQFSNPKGINNYHNHIINHYLFCYAKIFYELKEIENFDFIKNMVAWCVKECCYDLIKPNFDIRFKEVNRSSFDRFNNVYRYEYDQEVREAFAGLYRDIQINKILNSDF